MQPFQTVAEDVWSVGPKHNMTHPFNSALEILLVTYVFVLAAVSGGSGDRPTLSRRKSLQKSLRDSFRRLRRRRSEPARPGGDRRKDTGTTSSTPTTAYATWVTLYLCSTLNCLLCTWLISWILHWALYYFLDVGYPHFLVVESGMWCRRL